MRAGLLLTLVASTFLIASPRAAIAADGNVDIMSWAPREPKSTLELALLQIELNIAVKQYEKVQMDLLEARLQAEMGLEVANASDDQRKEYEARAHRKVEWLDREAAHLQKKISDILLRAVNLSTKASEEEKAAPEVKPKGRS
jgi:hypothetical protein